MISSTGLVCHKMLLTARVIRVGRLRTGTIAAEDIIADRPLPSSLKETKGIAKHATNITHGSSTNTPKKSPNQKL
jgi:hypothetical protein